MGTISYQCLSKEHKHLIDQRQTNGRNQQSISLYRHKHLIDQTQTNGRDLISYQSQLKACNYQWQITGQDPQPQNREQLLSRSMKFLYQLIYLRFICYNLKLIDIITIPTSLSISHD